MQYLDGTVKTVQAGDSLRITEEPVSSPRTRERLADVGSLEHLTNEADPPDERQRDEGGTLHEPQCDQVGLADGQQPHVVVDELLFVRRPDVQGGSGWFTRKVARRRSLWDSKCVTMRRSIARQDSASPASISTPLTARATAARRHRPEEGERPFQTIRAGRPSALRRRSSVTEPTPAAVCRVLAPCADRRLHDTLSETDEFRCYVGRPVRAPAARAALTPQMHMIDVEESRRETTLASHTPAIDHMGPSA